jgi:hypothetical protein
MIASVARAYPNGAPFQAPLEGEAPSLAHKYWTKAKVTDSNKHSSLLRSRINEQRKFTSRTGSWPETIQVRHLSRTPLWARFLVLPPKYKTRLERLVTYKHSSLLRIFINYGRKEFYKIEPWAQCYKTSFVRNLRNFIIS